MALTQVSTGGIKDGTISNADLDASAAIDGSKVSPDFGSQNITTTGTVTGASLIPSSSTVPTNGVYLPATNSVAISTGGSGRLFINSSGSVGVGTSTPGELLHLASGSSPAIRIKNTNAGVGTFSQLQLATANSFDEGRVVLKGISENAGNNSVTFAVETSAAGGSPTEKLRITSAGSVGIGTTSVSSKLHVLNPSGGAYTTPATTIERDNSGDFIRLHRNAGSGNDGGLIGADSVAAYFAAGSNTNNKLYIDGSNAVMQFYTNGSERVRIDTDGRLLVGTSSSSAEAKFIVQGGATASGGAMNIQRSLTTASAGSTIGFINFTNSANNVGATISADGAGTWNAGTSHPTLLKFSTTSDNASSPSERLRIASTGAFGLSGANYGSSGQVLTSQGSGAAPQWATPSSGSLVFISSVAASGSSVVFNNLTHGYKVYFLTYEGILATSADLRMRTSTNNGSSFDSGSTDYTYTVVGASTYSYGAGRSYMEFNYTGSSTSAATPCSQNGILYMYNLNQSSLYANFGGSAHGSGGTSVAPGLNIFAGERRSTTAVNAVQFFPATGTFSGGTFRLYGLKNS